MNVLPTIVVFQMLSAVGSLRITEPYSLKGPHHHRQSQVPSGSPNLAKEADVSMSSVQALFTDNGEAQVIEKICSVIQCDSKKYVELGIKNKANCTGSCSREYLDGQNWTGYTLNKGQHNDEILDRVSVATWEDGLQPEEGRDVLQHLHKHNTPENFDFLDVDLNGMNFFVLQRILCTDYYNPKIIMVKYNPRIPSTSGAYVAPLWVAVNLPYAPEYFCPATNNAQCTNCMDYCNGMSLGSVKSLGNKYGYELMYANDAGSAFLVRKDTLPETFVVPSLAGLDQPSSYAAQGKTFWKTAQKEWKDSDEASMLTDCHSVRAFEEAEVARKAEVESATQKRKEEHRGEMSQEKLDEAMKKYQEKSKRILDRSIEVQEAVAKAYEEAAARAKIGFEEAKQARARAEMAKKHLMMQ